MLWTFFIQVLVPKFNSPRNFVVRFRRFRALFAAIFVHLPVENKSIIVTTSVVGRQIRLNSSSAFSDGSLTANMSQRKLSSFWTQKKDDHVTETKAQSGNVVTESDADESATKTSKTRRKCRIIESRLVGKRVKWKMVSVCGVIVFLFSIRQRGRA